MFGGLLTGLSTRLQVKKLAARVTEQDEFIASLVKAHQKLDADIIELRGAQNKLRGKLYGDGLHKEQRPQNREERRAAALSGRFVPGRPVTHGED